MLEIAENFPNPQKYRDAAQRFRLPYWDYYRPRGNKADFPGVRLGKGRTSFNYDFSIPQIFTLEQVIVRTPEKDELELRDNPMNFFKFPATGSIPEDEWQILGLDVSKNTLTADLPFANINHRRLLSHDNEPYDIQPPLSHWRETLLN